ncbi:cytochrome c oxidase subunit II (mitochondrion) [Nilaparvata lugens]|uniref:Cytochrome c oxidase subunit 2 n=2 Tax=Nilaparvata lugens TaxID=108931 RepID=S4TJ12_NILLU|nr:cytochrome c oxidase subunit II [Nilaparvata lugens]UVW80471.1 cytochrome c oxidase subunit II [Leptocorisa oratoria]AEP27254.1 cytochrome c oxidase subunit II [Nilaparvata lugens]AEP27267.1 cytochrome c oxidase subunit II [Nilaparvata lugens]AEP27281.1 cytochrome c oxidase subunit II [Nilaparvata lugens]AGC22526.1 cytochrome c oxidase subunit II [Nilaparvata lugens]
MSWTKLYLPDAYSPTMEQLTFFHDHTMSIIISITTMIVFLLNSLIYNKLIDLNINENQVIETWWTILPTIILFFVAIPSLKILYSMEELINPTISIKSMGHQWYWSYEYSDKLKKEFDSYMKYSKISDFRLIEVDNRMKAPFLTQLRMIFSSSDVLHSWTIPSLGVKMDAIPGRLNQSSMLIKKPGLFTGQCSEICGTNHSFMPIMLESVKLEKFVKWMK